MLQIINLHKKFGDFTVLKDISLELPETGIYALLAPNGAGKTTLMKLITTLLKPTGGKILYNGEDIYRLGAEYRELIGYMPQDLGYYANYSPVAFLKYIAALKGVPTGTAKKRITELLEMLSLYDVRNKKLGKFSGGMLRREGIAQAMLNDPKILILDEPTVGLDPKESLVFKNYIRTLSESKLIIISTHILSDVESLANTIVMIKDHNILFDDTLNNICGSLTGKISSATVAIDDIEKFEGEHEILSQRQNGNSVTYHFITKPEESLQYPQAVPTLEDIFIYYYTVS